jgi:hypothetical protein
MPVAVAVDGGARLGEAEQSAALVAEVELLFGYRRWLVCGR